MAADKPVRLLVRHERIVWIALLTAVPSLIVFRAGIELGLASSGSIRVYSIPLEYLFLAWFVVLIGATCGRRRLPPAVRFMSARFDWWLGVLGLAGIFWLASTMGAQRFPFREAWAYRLASVAVVAVFLSACVVLNSNTTVPLGTTLRHVARMSARPIIWLCIIASVAVIRFAPRSPDTPNTGAALRRWYLRQPILMVPASWHAGRVTLVEFVDYQCPACRAAEARYHDVIRQAELDYPGAFAFLKRDFPLDSECNPMWSGLPDSSPHPVACEAAAAVRLAGESGIDHQRLVVDWLWEHQSALSADALFEGLLTTFDLDLRARYGELVARVRAEAAQGRALGVAATPTYLLNGRRLRPVAPSTLQELIAIAFYSGGGAASQ